MPFKLIKALLFDFEDSFTYNIASMVEKQGFSCEVVHYKNLNKVEDYIVDFGFNLIILGPGPGHPNDNNYRIFFNNIKNLINLREITVVGICLGHQLIYCALAGNSCIGQKAFPIHGKSEKIKLPDWPLFQKDKIQLKKYLVQFYNSLFVKENKKIKSLRNKGFHFSFKKNQLILSYRMKDSKRLITYQFHPESIGTENSDLFFEIIKKMTLGSLF